MQAKFRIKKEELTKIRAFKSSIYANVDEISSLENDTLWVLNDTTLVVCAYGATARGKTALTKFAVDVTDVTKDSDFFWWAAPLERFIIASDKISDDEVIIAVDSTKQKITYSSATSKDSAWITTVNQLTEAEAKEHLNELSDLITGKEAIDTIHITDALVAQLTTIKSALKISASTEAIKIEKRVVKSADTVAVIAAETPTDNITGEEVMLGVNTANLLKSLVKWGDFDIAVYQDGPAIINYVKLTSAPVELAWTNSSFKFEFPTETELSQVVPEAAKRTVVKVKRDDIKSTFEKFEGLFENAKWRWAQTYWDWDPAAPTAFVCHYEDLMGEIRTELPVQLVEDTDKTKHSMFIPTNYAKVILGLTDADELELTFNSVDEQAPHGIGVQLEGGGIRAVICKLVKSA